MARVYMGEKIYQLSRAFMGKINHLFINDYESVVNAGQYFISFLKISSLYTNYSQYLANLNIKRHVFSLQFDSPITFAAFESHLDSLMLWRFLGCGGGCLKTIKITPESGNPRPRLQQIKLDGKEHLLNALGLPGPGVMALIQQLKNHPLSDWHCPLGFSIGGHSIEEYKLAIEQLLPFIGSAIQQPYIELNISCPNTVTGTSLHDNLSELNELIAWIRHHTHRVISIKVSPTASNANLCDIASLAKQHSETTINAGNTQYNAVNTLPFTRQQFSMPGGGISGPRLFSRTLEMAKLLGQFKLPLIATGGISSSSQIETLFEHGVQVVGCATQLVKNPFWIVKTNQTLGTVSNEQSP
jgi:dihydroorotate dehydrogenase